MDELPSLEAPEKSLPRWVQISVGLALSLFTLFCGFASLSLFLPWPGKKPVFGAALGIVLLLGCLWVLEKCFRLLTGRRNQGGLMAPKTLRAVSLLFLVLPIAGLFTGYYRRMGYFAIGQALQYFFIFLALRALARRREAQGRDIQNVPVIHETSVQSFDEPTSR